MIRLLLAGTTKRPPHKPDFPNPSGDQAIRRKSSDSNLLHRPG